MKRLAFFAIILTVFSFFVFSSEKAFSNSGDKILKVLESKEGKEFLKATQYELQKFEYSDVDFYTLIKKIKKEIDMANPEDVVIIRGGELVSYCGETSLPRCFFEPIKFMTRIFVLGFLERESPESLIKIKDGNGKNIALKVNKILYYKCSVQFLKYYLQNVKKIYASR